MHKKRVLIVIFLILLFTILFFKIFLAEKQYKVENNSLYYSLNRGVPEYSMDLYEKNESYNIYKISFYSRDFLNQKTRIYGLFYMPINKTNVPGMIFLPAGAGTKESRDEISSFIAKQGYGVLTIDQRGIGETGGTYLNFNEDYNIFLKGNEPIQHLSVYDALRTFDVLRSMKNIDKENIGISGESMGARYAIIAAAIDKRLKGVIAISASGFHITRNSASDLKQFSYLTSIDPDNYISKISSNKVFMIHCVNDSVILLKDAQDTFNLAQEPKKLTIFENCNHGYSSNMNNELKEDLSALFDK
ncbi:MAG: alpha/beta hydrolase [Nanoarchaeota archaeon]|nr:alpha/beta hydrolase [Nanoarchaeota archaeon]